MASRLVINGHPFSITAKLNCAWSNSNALALTTGYAAFRGVFRFDCGRETVKLHNTATGHSRDDVNKIYRESVVVYSLERWDMFSIDIIAQCKKSNDNNKKSK